MRLNSYSGSYSGIYTVDTDPNGGAIGIVDLGVSVKPHAWITDFFIGNIDPLTSGGLASTQFGYIQSGTLVPIVDTQIFSGPNAFNAWPVYPLISYQLTTYMKFDFPFNVVMEITGAALTGGKLIFGFNYMQTEM